MPDSGRADGNGDRGETDHDIDVRRVRDAVIGAQGIGGGGGDAPEPARTAAKRDVPDPALVARSWTHVHEEDQGDLQAYRPSDADLPPARGRTTLDLAPDGTLQRRTPGPDDRSVVHGGSWELRGRRLIVRPDGGLPFELEIEQLEPDRLLVRPTSHSAEGEPHA